jgi:hypothetical protein
VPGRLKVWFHDAPAFIVPELISCAPCEGTLCGVKSALAHSTVSPDFTSIFSGENLSSFIPTCVAGFAAVVAGEVATLLLVSAALLAGVAETAFALSVFFSVCLPSKNPATKMTMAQRTRAFIESGPETIQISRRARSSALMTLRNDMPSCVSQEGASKCFADLLERRLQLFGVIKVRDKDRSRAFQ